MIRMRRRCWPRLHQLFAVRGDCRGEALRHPARAGDDGFAVVGFDVEADVETRDADFAGNFGRQAVAEVLVAFGVGNH